MSGVFELIGFSHQKAHEQAQFNLKLPKYTNSCEGRDRDLMGAGTVRLNHQCSTWTTSLFDLLPRFREPDFLSGNGLPIEMVPTGWNSAGIFSRSLMPWRLKTPEKPASAA